jgi:hypothetical protein
MKKYRETLDSDNKKVYDLFVKYKPESNIFIETGCHLGGGITKAINAGYNKIYSCDINMSRVEHCINLISEMAGAGNYGQMPFGIVEPWLYNSSSVEFLTHLLPTINTDATFWLDAHDEGGGVPLFQELDLIKAFFKNKTSTIIMDDISLYISEKGLKGLQTIIKDINPDYNFEFIDTNRTNSILIAYIG